MNVALYLVLLFYAVYSLPVNYSTKRPKEDESGIPTKKPCQRSTCHFSVFRTNKLEKEPRPEKSIVSTECSTDIDKLGSYYDHALNPTTGENNAVSLILCRGAGICDQDFSKPEVKARWKNVPICKNHINELLDKWSDSNSKMLQKHIYRRSNKNACSMPDGLVDVHAGGRTNIFHHHLTVQEADLLMKEKGILVHPGIPVCRLHENYLLELKTNSEKNTGRRKSVVNYKEEEIEEAGSCNQDDSEDFCQTNQNSSPSISSLQKFAKAVGIDLPCSSRKKYSELQERSRQKKAVKVRKVCDAMIGMVAPDDEEEFRARVFKKQISDMASNDDENLNKILRQVSDHYLAAFDRRSRMIVLSQVADVLPYSSVVKYIPNLSRYMYGEARKFSRRNFDSEEPVKILERYNRTAVENFIEFITSPTIMIGLPYGLRKVKLSDGSKVEIPNSIRQQSSTEIYNMYHSVLEENGQMDLMLSKSTIFRILKVCEATERSATTCVDYFIANGMEAFDELHSIVDNWIEHDAVDLDILKELKVELHETAQYLRADYRLHIKKSSRIADHCATFALSDPNDLKMSLSCSSGDHAHKHDLKCSRCENGEATLNRIKNYAEDLLAETKDIPTNSDSEAQKKVDELVAKYEEQVQLISKYIDQVFEMKKHLLRAAVTNQEREDIINDLEDNHALITIDFAQKYLPRWHREKQSDYFGKKGLSWHVSHVAARIGENYTQHSFIHIYDSEVQQNSELVILTLSHIATELKKVGITTISIRSDNAGAYHCVSTIASLHWLMNEFGITVKSYSFSEAQNGKSSSDRDAARVKQKASRYVSMGNDITTSADFFKAIKSGKQLNGVSIYHGSVAKDLDGKAKWDGISDLNYFTVEENGIRARKYSGIGEGKFVPTEELVSMNGTYAFEEAGFVASGIGSIESERQAVRDGTQTKFWYYSPKRCTVSNCEEEIEETTTELDETVDTSSDQKKLFFCSHPGCSESFLKASGLEKHLLRGVHKVSPDKLTMNDYSLKMYSRGLEEVNRKRKNSGSIDVIAEAINGLKEETETVRLSTGWALAKKATRKAFVADVKQFLIQCFEEGLNKKRLNPSTIAKRMAAASNADGTKRFTVEQRLDVKQIAGFLSRESRKRRATSLRLRRDEKNVVHVVTQENVEDLEERHWDADWIDYIEDEMTWTEWDEFLTAIAESADPLFDYNNVDANPI